MESPPGFEPGHPPRQGDVLPLTPRRLDRRGYGPSARRVHGIRARSATRSAVASIQPTVGRLQRVAVGAQESKVLGPVVRPVAVDVIGHDGHLARGRVHFGPPAALAPVAARFAQPRLHPRGDHSTYIESGCFPGEPSADRLGPRRRPLALPGAVHATGPHAPPAWSVAADLSGCAVTVDAAVVRRGSARPRAEPLVAGDGAAPFALDGSGGPRDDAGSVVGGRAPHRAEPWVGRGVAAGGTSGHAPKRTTHRRQPWRRRDSNSRPPVCQTGALAN